MPNQWIIVALIDFIYSPYFQPREHRVVALSAPDDLTAFAAWFHG
jgi:hypothetical protein